MNLREKQKVEFEDQIKEIRREKRRLDDLLTIRENELEKIQSQSKQHDQKDTLINDLEKRIKHIEKKHEKIVAKLQTDVNKYKRRYE